MKASISSCLLLCEPGGPPPPRAVDMRPLKSIVENVEILAL